MMNVIGVTVPVYNMCYLYLPVSTLISTTLPAPTIYKSLTKVIPVLPFHIAIGLHTTIIGFQRSLFYITIRNSISM